MSTITRDEIEERIKVLASFSPAKIIVHFFSWRDRVYRVDSMNLYHVQRDEERQIYHFAVSAHGNSYQLTFDPATLEWYLKTVVAG